MGQPAFDLLGVAALGEVQEAQRVADALPIVVVVAEAGRNRVGLLLLDRLLERGGLPSLHGPQPPGGVGPLHRMPEHGDELGFRRHLGQPPRHVGVHEVVGGRLPGDPSVADRTFRREVGPVPAQPPAVVQVVEVDLLAVRGEDVGMVGQVVEQRGGPAALGTEDDEVRERPSGGGRHPPTPGQPASDPGRVEPALATGAPVPHRTPPTGRHPMAASVRPGGRAGAPGERVARPITRGWGTS